MLIRLDFADPQGGETRLRCAFEAPTDTLVAHTPEQIQPLLDKVQAHAQAGRWCVGYLRYEAASAFDKALLTYAADGPLAWFGVFEHALPWPPGPPAPADTVGPTQVRWHSPLSRDQFDNKLTTIHEAIGAGEYYQVNYTAPLHGDFVGSAPELFTRLQQAQPGGYAAYIDTGEEQILSVSPELFFDWDGQHILTRPMKGTAPRGQTPQEDAALVQALTASPKERAENVMIVDLLRNDLSRIAKPHTVQVPSLFAVQSLPTVHQMVSDVTAQTRPGTSLSEVFGALFPCGSITGAPKVRAMQAIYDLEPQARGVYCGAIGVVRPGGHATFNVAIRTVTIQGAQARCGIGSGITYDATAPNEWREWQHKRMFLERASEAFALLETLRLQAGVFHNLGAHLARLARAARHFGYPFDEERVRAALLTLLDPDMRSDDTTVWRVRLLLDAQGRPFAEKYKQNSTPDLVSIGLAATPFEAAQSEFTRFKTTRRSHYEAFTPTDPAIFDTLLYNERGELTECTRGNIAVLLDGQWFTPALHCGLLNGVGRAHFIAQDRLKEAVITLADLPRVHGLAFVNSLRGWVEARLVGTSD
ncbi:aminodeoxychorismate synthase component I [Rhodoferax sp. BLA1]|uniref:aminodeoxychorismate synthase component I n=1 Tax=Rhodoferax sp. BLA1 TaxID=2576062 RepID=UPI0015D3372E|nr:aminodeoxychorismate synthase component I [Rhodoferax sp. BLA1]